MPIARQKMRAKKFCKKIMDNTSTIKIFGDKYILQKTFDVLDYVGGIYGFDVLDNAKRFLFHIDDENEKLVESEIKWRIYRSIL